MRTRIAIALLVGTAGFARAEAPAAKDATARIERIALFKNGLGYVTSVATLPDQARTVRFGQLPVPSYGTFWVGHGEGVRLRGLVTGLEQVDEPSAVQGVGQLLRLNAGRKVVLRTGPAEKDVVEGVVLKGEAPGRSPEPPGSYAMGVRRPPNRYGHPVEPPDAAVVLVRTEQGIVALNPGVIQRVDFDGGDVASVATRTEQRPSIRMELDKPAGGERVAISYLARGITWVPGYRIDLSDAKTARFSAQAQVINELADLDAVQLELVTGYPNIQFAELPNPVAMSQSLAEFLKSLAAGRAEGGEGGLMQQQALQFNNAYAFERSPLPEYSTAVAGATAEDLFLYPVPKFSLKQGETATVPLFTADMPYRHLYTWRIGDQLDGSENNRRGPRNAEGRVAEEVWHVCRFVNAAKMPLTTAAAEFVKDGQFTGQDTCYYTGAGCEGTIRINRAMNLQAEQAEVEVERKRNAANFHGYSHDLVKLTGELKLHSGLDQVASVEITKELSGEVLDKAPDVKDVQTARGLKQVNPRHVLTWNIEVKPGEEKKLAYSYQIYIRN